MREKRSNGCSYYFDSPRFQLPDDDEEEKTKRKRKRMPAQKRSSSSDNLEGEEASPPDHRHDDHQQNQQKREGEPDDSDGERSSCGEKDEFVVIKLSDIRKEVQCPICLGIIRKTRTVMECLHRFCRECIDKSMRLGNNECPACRTHCASRRSLRDDANYDALIAALYPDIDKYEEEELAFHQEEKTRNKQIQASIAQTLRRQSEALGRRRTTAKATAAAFVRRSHGNYQSNHGQNSYSRVRPRNGQDIGLAGSSDDDEDANGNEGAKYFSSADEPSPEVRHKRQKRWSAPRYMTASAAVTNADGGYAENDETEVTRENTGASPGRTAEVLVWGKGGTRSHTRHGSLSGTNGKTARSSRIAKLVDFIRNFDGKDGEFDIRVTLLPLDEQSTPSLQLPCLTCRSSLSIRHLRQFIAQQMAVEAEEVEILVKDPWCSTSSHCESTVNTSVHDQISKSKCDPSTKGKEVQILSAQETLAGLHASNHGNLVLVYRSRLRS